MTSSIPRESKLEDNFNQVKKKLGLYNNLIICVAFLGLLEPEPESWTFIFFGVVVRISCIILEDGLKKIPTHFLGQASQLLEL